MNSIEDITKRLERLEKAVFGVVDTGKCTKETTLEEDFIKSMNAINEELICVKNHFEEKDIIILQAIMTNEKTTGDYHVTSLFTLSEEEDDDEVARLCSALSSKQRIYILKHLAQNEMSSGELASVTKMAGGHLHHHLNELMNNNMIYKTNCGKYTATRDGINTYLTIAGLNRRLEYDSRKGSK